MPGLMLCCLRLVKKRIFKTYLLVVILTFFKLELVIGQALPVDRNVAQSYIKGTRNHTGAPGQNYWQNSADYIINLQFNPASRELKGTVNITYFNHSPDTLKTLLFKLYPNLYKGDAMRNTIIAQEDLGSGVRISNMQINEHAIDSPGRIARGTNMYVRKMQILPGQKTNIHIEYSYTLNRGSFMRTGQIDTGTFFIAYFFPRVAVYDDVDGWDEHNYSGKEEFYNDYGNFDVSISVPGDFRIWATGDLKNPAEVYEQEMINRIMEAERSDSVTDIISPGEIKKGNITKQNPINKWHFVANNVTDFAFAVSNNYVWKASSIMVDSNTKRRTRVDAVYNPLHTNYLPVVNYNRKTVELISYYFPAIPFPYAHITIVDGLDAMEYPMMVNNLPFEEPKDVVEFTAHEVFHTLFPFYVGTNETKYSFMDEGLATMTEFMFHPVIAPGIKMDYDLSPVNDYAGLAEDLPVLTPTPQLYGKTRYADKDLKPALALWYLKEMLGEKLFVSAMQSYIRLWAGKHPTPYDFFNCINSATKQNLDWFWKTWYVEKAIPDLSISKVTHTGTKYTLTIENRGGAAVPVHLTLFSKDGSTRVLNRNISVWANNKKNLLLHITVKSEVQKIILGDAYDVDIHPNDNIWNSRADN